MKNQPPAPCKEGDRIELIQMASDDPCPIPAGTRGTVISVCFFQNSHQITVDWDAPRSLSLVCPPDQFRILPPEREYTMDVKLFTSIRVKATSQEEAERMIQSALDGAEANFGAWETSGDPILSTVSTDGTPDLIEIDGEAV
ncbi:DUF4314 domain-containing protein [Aliiroseovarius crassostreae]|nr:DUF4314 domain-containing protein [Aliiroseovarius crassostreae]